MANNCAYDMAVVGMKRESVERMMDILSYNDCEFCLYRVFDADMQEQVSNDDGMWRAIYVGDMAWQADAWIRDPVSMDDMNSKGAHKSNLQEICKALDVGVEVWFEEEGMCIQGHYVVNHEGCVTLNEFKEDVEFPDWDGEDEEVRNGLPEYGKWSPSEDVY